MMSKTQFLNQLALRLSFHLPYSEVTQIVCDYEEWIENEKDAGYTENAVCSKLNISNIIHENMLSDSTNFYKKITQFLSNPPLRILLGFVCAYIIEFYFLRMASKNAIPYGMISLLMNVLFFLCCKVNVSHLKQIDTNHYNGSMLAAILYSGIVILAPVFIYSLRNVLPGKLCSIFLFFVGFSAFFLGISMIVSHILEITHFLSFIMFLHGIFSVLFFDMSQLHTMYTSLDDIRKFILWSIAILLETVLLSFLRRRKE